MRVKRDSLPDVFVCLAALVLALAPVGARAAEPETAPAAEAVPAELVKQVDALVRGMAADGYAEREKASDEAAKLPAAAAEFLQKLSHSHEDPEVRWRCEEALAAIRWKQFVAGNKLIDYAGHEDVRKVLQQEYKGRLGSNSYNMLNSWLMQRKPACMLMTQGNGMRARTRQPIFPARKIVTMKGEELLIRLLTESRTRAQVGKPQNVGRVKRFPIMIYAFEDSPKDAAKPARGVPGQVLQIHRQGGGQVQVNGAGGFVIRAGVNAGGGDAAAVKVEKIEKPERKKKPDKKEEKPGKDDKAGEAPAAGAPGDEKKEEKPPATE